MESSLNLDDKLKLQEKHSHELSFRDKVKKAQFHYAVSFNFEGFFEEDKIKEELFNKIKFLCKEIDFSSFKLGVRWPINSDDAEKMHLKIALQTPLIKLLSSELMKVADFSDPDLEFFIDFNKSTVFVRLKSVYVKGNYCKYSREIAQTEFFCNKCMGYGCWYCKNTGHFSVDSVEQLLSKTLTPAFEGKLLIMHGAGREDLDVLMLGKGRPFVAEILLPKKRSCDLEKVEKEINSSNKGKISVTNLSICPRGDVSITKDSMHDKIYSALVVAQKEVDYSKIPLNKKLQIIQTTPTRVEKRRAHLHREKEVTLLGFKVISKREFVLTLRTSHGTYVKEFISGDGAKTKPSLASILNNECSCELLDVMEICE